MIEKKWLAVAPQLFTADGNTEGVIPLANTFGFKVKQKVVLVNPNLPANQQNLQLQVKRVYKTKLIVGPIPTQQGQQSLTVRYDISAFTVADGSYVYAQEQDKSTLKPDDIVQAVYEQEPTVAIRTIFVDQNGDFYDEGNPLPIAFDGTVQVGNVTIQDDDGDELAINPDGSINVNILPSTSNTNLVVNTFGTASAVISGSTTSIVTYTVPSNKKSILQRIVASGENIGTYTVQVNGTNVSVLRTYFFGPFNVTFDFITGQDNGLVLQPGDIVTVSILHTRPFTANFDGRIQVFEILQ